MKRLLFIIFWVWGVSILAQGVSYVRYYLSEDDFVRGVEMVATERYGVAHIQVLLDKEDKVISKAKVDASGRIIEEEVYDYDIVGNLIKRSVRDENGQTQKLFVYGDDEEMSRIFIAFAFPNRDPKDFKDRITNYDYRPDGEIESYRFLSIDNTEFGRISYDYFETGLIKQERWINSLSGKIVRLFRYQYDPESRKYELTEYDSMGSAISHIGLILPQESALIGGTGAIQSKGGESLDQPANILEESGEIIQDILKRKTEGWNPAEDLGPLFQKEILNSPDMIYLKNGDTLQVDLLQITDDYVRCFIFDEKEILSIPLSTVGEIERRDGKIVYPILY